VKPVAIVAVGAESALGSGVAAYSVGPVGAAPTTRIVEDARLREAGLGKPFVARARPFARGTIDPAAALLESAARLLVEELDTRFPLWTRERVALVVGTSSGGMFPLTDALRRRAEGDPIPPDIARAAPYFGPLAGLCAALRVDACERIQVLGACASSGIAIGIGCRLLEFEHATLVVAGGYDAVSVLVAAGFECLGATSATRPAPFRVGRDGMALGEAAVLVALMPARAARGSLLGYVSGFGTTCDAVHVTAPDRSGAGLARAALCALADAGIDAGAVDLVSAHGTATPFNDTAEARALSTVLGARSSRVVLHPFKAVVGHTLGASAALELVSALDAMKRRVLPAAVGEGEVDPETSVRLLATNEEGDVSHCLKFSAAFGGANAALVVSRDASAGHPLERGGVAVVATGEPRRAADIDDIAGRTRIPPLQMSRLDPLSAASVSAVASALDRAGQLPRERTGVVVGTATATIENDASFESRLRERGVRAAEPRRFPPTSPNLSAGQCAIAFGLLGPSLSVGAGPEAPLEALLVAHDLVAGGDADAMVVVAAEHVGDVVTDLWAAAGWPLPACGAIALVLQRSAAAPLDRSRLRALLLEARAADGRLGAAAPGWPTLAAALSRIAAA
jgi:3-oxoacyl-[acyl-carrier-protein] synthase II